MDQYLGEIRLFAGTYAPVNWHLCDGTLLSLTQYQALFALLGTLYGGDGRTNFAVPDLRGRLPINMGQGQGLSARTLGASGGAEGVTLTVANLPAHTHTLSATSTVGGATVPSGGLLAALNAPATQYVTHLTNVVTQSMASQAIGTSDGAGDAHLNVMPSMALTYIIALEGIFPTPN